MGYVKDIKRFWIQKKNIISLKKKNIFENIVISFKIILSFNFFERLFFKTLKTWEAVLFFLVSDIVHNFHFLD